MANTLPKPGVEVVQEFAAQAPTIVQPQLLGCSVGAAFEVVEAQNADGTVNSDALEGTYDQYPVVVPQSDFPSPRGNIDEVDVLEDEIETFLTFGSDLLQLPIRPYGDAFLKSVNDSRRAAFFVEKTVFNLDGLTLSFSVDQASRLSTDNDVRVQFSGLGLSPAQVADQINDAAASVVGQDVAFAYPTASPTGLLIASPTYSALSALTFKAGSSAAIGFGLPATQDVRVEGSGFRAFDDADGDLTSPWIMWETGGWYLDGSSAEGSAKQTWGGLNAITGASFYAEPNTLKYNEQGDELEEGGANAVSFTSSTGETALPLQAATADLPGDVMYGDGVWIKSAEVIKVESSRFKLGVLNARLTTYDNDGDPVVRVYDPVEVETVFNTSPFAPRFAWFQAQGLDYSTLSSSSLAANLVSDDATPAQNAEVMSDIDVASESYPRDAGVPGQFSLTGLILKLRHWIDGTEQPEESYTFTSTYDLSTVTGRAQFLTDLGNGFSSAFAFSWTVVAGAYYLTITLTDSGSSDDRIIVSYDGSANVAFNFSQLSPGTRGDGADPSFGPADVADLGASFDWFINLALKVRHFAAGDVITAGPTSATVAAGGTGSVVPLVPGSIVGPGFNVGDTITDGGGLSTGYVTGVDPDYLIIQWFAVGQNITNGGGVTGVVSRVMDLPTAGFTLVGVESVAGGNFLVSDVLDDGANPIGQLFSAPNWAALGFPDYNRANGMVFLDAAGNPVYELNIDIDRDIYGTSNPPLYAVAVDFVGVEPQAGVDYGAGQIVWLGAPVPGPGADLAEIVAAYRFPNGGLGEGMLILRGMQTPALWIPGAPLQADDGTPAPLAPSSVIAAGAAPFTGIPLPVDNAWGATVYNEISELVADMNAVTDHNGVAWLGNYLELYDASENELMRLGIRSEGVIVSNEVRITVSAINTRAAIVNPIDNLEDDTLGFWATKFSDGTGRQQRPELKGGALTFPLTIPGVAPATVTGINLSGDEWVNDLAADIVGIPNVRELLLGASGLWYGLMSPFTPGTPPALPLAPIPNPWRAAGVEAYNTVEGGQDVLVLRGPTDGFAQSVESEATTQTYEGWQLLNLAVGALGFGTDSLNGNRLRFQFNGSPRVYDTVAPSNSLLALIDAINSDAGFDVASLGGTTNEALKLTSPLTGVASSVQMLDADPDEDSAWNTDPTLFPGAAAAWRLGMTTRDGVGGNDFAVGAGRPLPDAYVPTATGSLHVGAEIFRHPTTGYPLYPAVGNHYIEYRAHRLDVTPRAANPGLLVFNDTDEEDDALSPLDTNNPLGLGVFIQTLNAPGVQNSCLGVPEISTGAMDGTLQGYAEALDFLEKEDVYGMAPLTHMDTVHQAFNTHVLAMSEPDRRGERIFFFNPPVPTFANPTLVSSGTDGESVAGQTAQFLMDSNPAAALAAQGLDPALPFTVDDGVYIELTAGGETRHYNLSGVNASLALFNLGPFTDPDDQSFYSTTPLTETLSGEDWSLFIRGAKLVIPGTTRVDYGAVAETVAGAAAGYKNRRAYYVFPDRAKTNLSGTEIEIEGYYLCSAAAGMCAQLAPQQGHTNYPMAGFTGVIGSNDVMRDDQMDTMAAGGVYTIIQEVDGAPLTCRHQLSTDTTSIETRELSITKAVDYVAKFLRTGIKNFIGISNITPELLDTISAVVQGHLDFLLESGIIAGGEVNNIVQDSTQPDRVLVDVTLKVLYPCNYIRLTLVI